MKSHFEEIVNLVPIKICGKIVNIEKVKRIEIYDEPFDPEKEFNNNVEYSGFGNKTVYRKYVKKNKVSPINNSKKIVAVLHKKDGTTKNIKG